ncbi:MAG TPA: hypothetical protein VI643_01780 [Planctomycetota bacterium]|nr:hypothetical protein [Planctomycetota bacterium]
MRNIFRSLERSGVEYLLISGQASILYGAATFSEDIDIWIRPTRANARNFVQALKACRARVRKLTPLLTPRNMLAGHGFHFEIPSKPIPVYLDVMGRPPRVGPFPAARRRARVMKTEWGGLPVVSITDLISLKKTRRLLDYEVISNLVSIRVAEEPRPAPSLLKWAALSSFRAEDRAEFLRKLGSRASVEACRRRIASEIVVLQARDAAYWSKRIRELRRMRRGNRLWQEGALV